jgi:hypothetical protein
MADGQFRVTMIALDEDEEVSAVTAAVGTATLGVIRDFLPGINWTVLSEAESEIVMPVQDALRLFRECGKLNGLDPRHEHTHRIYDSLCNVVYGLISDE